MSTVPRAIVWVAALLTVLGGPASIEAQQVRGRVLDATNGQPVQLAGVWLLDRDRGQVDLAMADSVGRYFVTVPDSGEYFIVAERFGYFETESPLLAISGSRDYDLDLELRPEPIRVEGLDVAVRNEEVVRWLTLEYGRNPSEFFGFRILQGTRLQEAKTKGRFDPTQTMRWLYIPVSHGGCVSINANSYAEIVSPMAGPRARPFEPGAVPGGTSERTAQGSEADPDADPCGGTSLFVNDRHVPNSLLDTVDMRSIAVVITLPNLVRMYTYDFDWAFRE